MSTNTTVRAWSATAANNNTADAAIASSDTQSPDSIDDNIRTVMAAVKRQENDTGGALAAGGTANALTVTTGQVLESGQLVAGLRLLLRATAANTSATVTFAPDGLTAANIKRADGSALAVGSIASGQYLDLCYNTGSSEWRAVNIAPLVAGGFGSALASFSAHKNGSNQTGIASGVITKVTFGTEIYDVGAAFATSTWTPPAGKILITAAFRISTTTQSQRPTIYIYKNGAQFKFAIGSWSSGADSASFITMMDAATGTDTYEVYIYNLTSGGATMTIPGAAEEAYFMGSII